MGIEEVINGQRKENDKLRAAKQAAELSRKKLITTIAGLFVYPAVNLFLAMWVMLGLGAAHDQFPMIPPLGFWTTYLICTGISCISGFIHHGNRVSFKKEGI